MTITITAANVHDALGTALAEPDFDTRRGMLRQIGFAALAEATNNHEIDGVLKHCPLVGDGPTQLKPRHTIAGLRDFLCEEALVMLGFEWGAGDLPTRGRGCSAALIDPSAHGVRQPQEPDGLRLRARA